MSKPNEFKFMLLATLMVTSAQAAQDIAYPSRPIRMLAAEPGGGNDFAARLIAQGLSASMGQQVIVDNRGGGSGTIAAETVAKATPDGHTLLFYGSPFWLAPYLRERVSYDPISDFAPVSLAVNSPSVLVVHPSLAARSIQELIALAKAKPGTLNYGSGPSGGANHLAAELFKSMAGLNIVHVPYKGNAQALNDLFAGQVQLMFPTVTSVAPHLTSGKLRALGVTGAQPSALLPGVPTVAAEGLPGYEAAAIQGIFVPAKTPAAVVVALNEHVVKVLSNADVKQKFLNVGVETVGSTPAQFAARVKSEMSKMGKVIKDNGIRGE
jgi:tripartite-type tricarboxylate transporter receptor subunit TctC